MFPDAAVALGVGRKKERGQSHFGTRRRNSFGKLESGLFIYFHYGNITSQPLQEVPIPRLPRLFAPGQTHHLIQRGNNRSAIFFDDADRQAYLGWLGEALACEGCTLHAYVLMTNHVHLLVTADHPSSLPRALQSLGRRYVGHVNRLHHRTGTLWEGRYKSTVVDSETYVLACHRYIETNPLRAGMVSVPEGYPWSSFHHNALGRPDPLLTPHPVYVALGPTPANRRDAYIALFRHALDDETVAAIRDATQRSWALGSERFQQEIARALQRRVTPPKRGRPPKTETPDSDGNKEQFHLI